MAQEPRVEGMDVSEDWSSYSGAFTEYLGIEFDLFSPERVEAHLIADKRHQQPYGIVHGGVYCAVVETVGSVAGAMTVHKDGNIVVGASNSTDFYRAHRTGRLDAVATPVHIGRTSHVWSVDITRESDGKLVAQGQLRLAVLPGDRMDAPGGTA